MDDLKDSPPHSRLFVSGTDCIDEKMFKEEFGKFGIVEGVQFVTRKENNRPRGIAYVKFSKASEAAFAMEALNQKSILNGFKPLIVKIAQDKSEPPYGKDTNEDDRILRLFIRVPPGEDEESIRSHFSQFGDVKKVVILKNKGRSGFAFVRFYKASDTALALENCDPNYKAIFGRLQDQTNDHTEDFIRDRKNDDYRTPRSSRSNYLTENNYNYSGNKNSYNNDGTEYINNDMLGDLIVHTKTPVDSRTFYQLFAVIPGLKFCKPQQNSNNTVFYVRYNSLKAAKYALDKLDQFEYPPTMPIHIVLAAGDDNSALLNSTLTTPNLTQGTNLMSNVMNCMSMMMGMTNNPMAPLMMNPNGQTAFDSGANTPYSSAVAANNFGTFYDGNSINNNSNNVPNTGNYCNVPLPPPKPLALKAGPTAERLWVMGYPKIPPMTALMDTFNRFGNLISIMPSKDRNYCYVHYADNVSADLAMKTIDQSTICQMEMKVVIANPPNNARDNKRSDDINDKGSSRKKQRY